MDGPSPAAAGRFPRPALGPLIQAVPAALLNFVIATLAYLLMADRILAVRGSRAQFPQFVAASNWASVTILAVMLPVMAFAHSGVLSTPAAAAVQVTAFLWSLFYEAYVFRAVLGSGWLTATGFVFLDIITSDLVSTLVRGPLVAG